MTMTPTVHRIDTRSAARNQLAVDIITNSKLKVEWHQLHGTARDDLLAAANGLLHYAASDQVNKLALRWLAREGEKR